MLLVSYFSRCSFNVVGANIVVGFYQFDFYLRASFQNSSSLCYKAGKAPLDDKLKLHTPRPHHMQITSILNMALSNRQTDRYLWIPGFWNTLWTNFQMERAGEWTWSVIRLSFRTTSVVTIWYDPSYPHSCRYLNDTWLLGRCLLELQLKVDLIWVACSLLVPDNNILSYIPENCPLKTRGNG